MVDLLGGKDAVVADVEDHHVPELAGGTQLPEHADSLRGLATAAGVEYRQIREFFGKRTHGAEHHRVADGSDRARGCSCGRVAWPPLCSRRWPLFASAVGGGRSLWSCSLASRLRSFRVRGSLLGRASGSRFM